MAWPFTRKAAPVAERVEPRLTRSFPARRVNGGAVRMFQGANPDRLTAGWATSPVTADDAVRRNQRSLVARSRDMAANNDYMRGFLRMVRQNVVGPSGIRIQAQVRRAKGDLDTAANDAIEAAFAEWSLPENCDVSGRRTLRAIQQAAVTSAARDGEFMFREIIGPDAGPWGYALQVLDPQRCPVDYDEERRPDGSFVRHGIQFNSYGRPLAYLFTSADEREANYTYGGRPFLRIPADEIIHGFIEDFTGQKRGLPWAATALLRMRMLQGFEHSAMVNARVSASKSGFFQWKEGYGPDRDEDDSLEMEAEPGTFQELPAGVEFKEWNPQYPSGEFAPFVKAALRGIATGMGVAYNNLANDLEGVNFSSIRQGALDEREHWKDIQEWLIEALLHRVYRRWLQVSLLSGRIVTNSRPLPADRIDRYTAVQFQPRRWAWIDPRADVASNTAQVQNLMLSFGQVIRDQGRDPQSVWREIAEDIAQMRAAGIPDDFIQQAMGQQLAPLGADQKGDADGAQQ